MEYSDIDLQDGATYDYIIVGSGSAGSIVAHILSMVPDNSVLLIEAGTTNSMPEISKPGNVHGLNGISQIQWGRKSTPQPRLRGRMMDLHQDNVLGGMSSHNTLVYARGARNNFNDWEDTHRCQGWSYDAVATYFDWIESRITPGEFTESAFNDAYKNAALELGYPYNPDYNTGLTQFGISPPQYSINKNTGKRESTFDTFIRPCLNRSNLHVASGVLTQKVLIDSRTNSAYGIIAESLGKKITLNASKEIHLCAGVFGSPQLLMLSGIGDAADLSRLGIPVICNSPGVGKNLQDHLLLTTLFSSAQPITGQPDNLAGYIIHGDMSTDNKSRISLTTSRGKYTCGQSPGDLENFYNIFVHVQNTQSLGSMWLQSNNIYSPQVINPQYFSNSADMELCRTGLKMALDLGNSAGLSAWRKQQITPFPSSNLNEYIINSARSISQPVGTCKMGVDDMAVVDSNLRVRGIHGLRVIDASVMPKIVQANTAATTMMIGVKGAAMTCPKVEAIIKDQCLETFI
jgi:choline dehydrogenase